MTQGASRDFTRMTPNDDGTFGGLYTGDESITYQVWPGDSEEAVLTQTGAPNAWIDATRTQWLICFSDAQTADLIPGDYRLIVTALAGGRTGVLFDGVLQVGSAPGDVVPAPANLATDYYVSKYLTAITPTNEQLELLPDLIAAASQLIRRFTMDRDFTRRTYTKDFPVALNGQVRLDQIPINAVLRVQTNPSTALTIVNTSATYATVRFQFTGSPFNNSQTITGITLTWYSGTMQTTDIDFVANMNINALRNAVNAVGSGWSATADSILGALPVTELIGGLVGQGCTGSASATLRVFAEDVGNVRFHGDDGQNTGMIWVGRQRQGLGPRWGPDWGGWSDPEPFTGVVRVTYDAGFDVVPAPVQKMTAELVRLAILRLRINPLIKSETAGEYSYMFNDQFLKQVAPDLLAEVASYRIQNA